jgi:hypothetical protein
MIRKTHTKSEETNTLKVSRVIYSRLSEASQLRQDTGHKIDNAVTLDAASAIE